MKAQPLSDVTLGRIYHLSDEGWSPTSIAEKLRLSRTNVEKHVGAYLLSKARPRVTYAAVRESSFVAPPPLARLMAGR